MLIYAQLVLLQQKMQNRSLISHISFPHKVLMLLGLKLTLKCKIMSLRNIRHHAHADANANAEYELKLHKYQMSLHSVKSSQHMISNIVA